MIITCAVYLYKAHYVQVLRILDYTVLAMYIQALSSGRNDAVAIARIGRFVLLLCEALRSRFLQNVSFEMLGTVVEAMH